MTTKLGKRAATIKGLELSGYRKDALAQTRKYESYVLTDTVSGQTHRMYVGGSGALRSGRTVSDSVSLTDTRQHKQIMDIGRGVLAPPKAEQPTLAHEIRQQITKQVCGRKEICVTKADAGYNQHNTDWIVIREDDSRFSELAAARPDEVRFIENSELYGDSTAYDFQGAEDGQ